MQVNSNTKNFVSIGRVFLGKPLNGIVEIVAPGQYKLLVGNQRGEVWGRSSLPGGNG
jgi:hypothetical protein